MRYLQKTKNSISLTNNPSGQISTIIIFLILVSFCLFLGRFIALKSSPLVLGLVGGLIIGLITLLNTDLALVILIFSMLLSPELKIAEVPHRAVVVRLDDILLIMVFFAWLAKMAMNKQLGLLKRTPLNLPIGLYIFICIISTAFGIITRDVRPIKSFFYILKYIEYFMLYFMVTNHLRSYRQLKRFVTFLLITCAIVCAYGFIQIGRAPRITAPFEGDPEPNTLGGYLLLLFAVSAGLFLYSDSATWRFWSAALACFIIPPFLYTLSRGSYIGFILMFLFLILLTKKKRGLLIVILLLSIIFLPNLLPEKVINRIIETFIPGLVYEPLAGTRVALDFAAAQRIESWRSVLKKWTSRPLLGYGITGVGFIDTQFPLILGETGIIGLLIFFWLLIKIFRNGLRAFRFVDDNWSKGLTLGFLAGFVGLLFHSFSATTFIIVRIMEPFWFLTAIIMMLPRLTKEVQSEIKEV